MSIGIPDLWPDDVALSDVVSPVTILRHQAGRLHEKTKGLLEGEVRSIEEDSFVKHEFYIVAPALNRYHYFLLAIRHDKELVYPVQVQAEEFYDYNGAPWAHGQSEFTNMLGAVVGGARAKTTIHALIAKMNDSGLSTKSD